MNLDQQGYIHQRVQHQQNVYVMGEAHTDSIEEFWGLVKHGIGRVYDSGSLKHLQSYWDEHAFRYNHRDAQEPMFVSLLS